MSFTLPDLPYKYDALAPYMSRETLEHHHDKHHKAYVDTANKLLKGSEWEGKSLEAIVKGAHGKNAALFNNAGQHYNHTHFWQWMKPSGGGESTGISPCRWMNSSRTSGSRSTTRRSAWSLSTIARGTLAGATSIHQDAAS